MSNSTPHPAPRHGQTGSEPANSAPTIEAAPAGSTVEYFNPVLDVATGVETV